MLKSVSGFTTLKVHNNLSSNTLAVGNGSSNVAVNSTSISVGSSSINISINATSFSGTSNNTLYVGSVTAANVVSNNQLQSNLTNYQTIAGLSANVATLTANNTSYVGSVTAANVVSNNQLQSNLANYAPLSGAIFTGNVSITANLTVQGLIVAGNVEVLGANNLSIVDNMIYLNSNSINANPDLGIAANYNDGTYHHTGIFRDHSSGTWKVFDNYLPEPDASPFINQGDATFHIANFQANTLYAGNTSTYWFVANTAGITISDSIVNSTINATSFSGASNNTLYVGSVTAANVVSNNQLQSNLANYQTTVGLSANVAKLTANNTLYLGGIAAASYVQNTDSRTLSGNLTFTGTNTTITTNLSVVNSLATVAYFASNGNVGIGNTTPVDTLSINGTVFVNTSITVGNSTINTPITATTISLLNLSLMGF